MSIGGGDGTFGDNRLVEKTAGTTTSTMVGCGRNKVHVGEDVWVLY